MESLSFIPVTLASVLASFSGDNTNTEQAVIATHVSPEIAGLWELDLEASPDFALPNSKINSVENGGEIKNEDLENLIFTIQESTRLADEAESAADEATGNSSFEADESIKSMTNNTNMSAQNQNNQCRERYNFGADNVLLTTSGEEWTYGKYLYHHQEEGMPIIAITTTYDNNKMDCSGRQIDQKGEALMAYVDYQPDNNKMRWCIDDEAEHCFMIFRQVLP